MSVEENGTQSPVCEDSLPSSSQPFSPIFEIRVADAVKNGEALQFTIKVKKLKDDDDGFVVRQFEDVEWLEHCIITQLNISGLILPPLPPRPEIDARSAESKSKKQLGSSTRVIVGDEFQKDCRNVEKYLRLLICHEVFGKERALENFLTLKEAPTRIKVKKSIMTKISSVVGEVRKGGHRDIDSYFQEMRDSANEYSSAIKEASANFNKMVFSQLRLAAAFCEMSSTVSITDVYKDDYYIQVNRLMGWLAEGLNDCKHGLEVLSANDEKTFGFHLDLYARYIDSVREMLFKRICLLVDYEDANKALEKAKPQKRPAAEEVQENAQKAYEQCTEIARKELQAFERQRLRAFQEGLASFAESQVKTARDTYALLVKCRASVNKIHL